MVWLGVVTASGPEPIQCPTSSAARNRLLTHGCTYMHFGENQLSPGSIGISPLATGHPPVLQHRWVRASTRSHPRFTLPMASSPGFGPPASDTPIPAPCSDSLSLRLHGSSRRLTWGPLPGPAADTNSPDHSSKGTPSPGWAGTEAPPQHHYLGFDCLRVWGFRFSFIPLAGCFSPFPHGTRALSVARSTPALEGGPPSFPQDYSCPVVLRIAAQKTPQRRRLRDSHPLRCRLPAASAWPWPVSLVGCPCWQRPPTPSRANPQRFGLRPASLATTTGLSYLISPPRGTQMFHFPRCPPDGL